MNILLMYKSEDKVWERIISLELSSYKSFFKPQVKIALERNGLSWPTSYSVNHKGEEYEKQIVSDSMSTHYDHWLKTLHPAAFHCVNNSESM